MSTSTPNTRISIRPARSSDRNFLTEIAARLANFEVPPWRTAEEIAGGDRRALLEQLDAPSRDNALFIAELDGQRAGCLLMWTLEDYFRGERHSHISVLAVTEAAEGRGVGRALMDHAEAWARSRGSARLTLSVFESNRRAQGLYERCGYEVEIRRYVKNLRQ